MTDPRACFHHWPQSAYANEWLAINLRDDPVTRTCVISPRGRASHQLRDWWSVDHPGYSHSHRRLHYLQVIAPQHSLPRRPFSMNSGYHRLHLFRITITFIYIHFYYCIFIIVVIVQVHKSTILKLGSSPRTAT